jgi:hypothetical protein
MKNIIAIGISLVLLTAGMALAVDDATLQEVENKAESANTKADGKYVYKPYIIRNLQDSNVRSGGNSVIGILPAASTAMAAQSMTNPNSRIIRRLLRTGF